MAPQTWVLFHIEGIPEYLLSFEQMYREAGRDAMFALNFAVQQAVEDFGGVRAGASAWVGADCWLVRFPGLAKARSALEALRSGLRVPYAPEGGRRLYLPVKGTWTEVFEQEVAVRQLTAALPASTFEGGLVDAAPLVEEMTASRMRDSVIYGELRRATQEGLFYLVYQPIVDFNSFKMASVEGLIRIKDCRFGPSELIPVAERTGYIDILGEQSLVLANQFWTMCQENEIPLKVAVNVSAIQLRKERFERGLAGIAMMHRLANRAPAFYSSFELEVTESQEMDVADHARLLRYTERGFSVALDDFGSSSASIQQWMPLPPGKVKIDRGLLLLGETAPDKFRALAQMAKAAGNKVVVEGIETLAQMQLAIDSGADYGQGFLFSKPTTEAQVLQIYGRTFDRETLEWN